MKRRQAPWILLFLSFALSAYCRGPADKEAFFQHVVSGMPDYREFLTVDELHASLRGLKERYPDLVSLDTVGKTDLGSPIYEFRVGKGKRHALLFGFPHPNEPIGSMMLHYLTEELAKNGKLRDFFDFTWHIVVCAEPDKARLNEGWFKGTLTLTKYARNYYRPPSYQQVEWTFPVTYKKYKFDTPTPEALALMKIIDGNRIDFSFGLHNSGFGGVYYYWSRDVPELYPAFYAFIADQGLPLHLGEPEVPWGKKFDSRAMFQMLYFKEGYDWMEKYSPTPPEKMMSGGESSDDYVRDKYHGLTVNCELPYFYDPGIEDTAPSDMTRAEAVLKGLENERMFLGFLGDEYRKAKPLLTVRSPFVDAIEELLRTGEDEIVSQENAVKAEKEYAKRATAAQKWDAVTLRKFYSVLNLGQFVRLLEFEKNRTAGAFPAVLQKVLNESLAEFERSSGEAEREFSYTVVPIKKLASVQLLTALYAMDYVQRL